ncbi:MAG: DUF177 domain-containing protein [Chloroflexi bacterium]|nr:DUF177 domain-containing protein [Anaerolineaceae bacterium]NMB90315.1 DUF177 domain-containing protein [Chloroflexota bacterium]
MNHSRHPLRFNVGFLLNQPIGTSRDIPFEFDRLSFSEDLEVAGLQGLARVTRTPQGILLQGDFQGEMVAECVRCLAEFQQPLHTEFSELFAFKYKGVSESGLMLPDDGNIDLAPLLREYLLLEVPIQPLCTPDCKGLCVVCGADLNATTCEHQARIAQE